MPLLNKLKRLYWHLRSPSGREYLRWKLGRQVLILSAYLWRRLLIRTTVIAIAGSVGKTTTKEMLFHVLSQQYPVICTPGNWNNRRFAGLEHTLLKVRPWHRYAVMETSIEKPGDMAAVVRLLKPDIAVMLSIKHCHAKSFKTLQEIADEKVAILKGLGSRGIAIVNYDDPLVKQMAQQLKCRIIAYGSDQTSDFRLYSAESRWPERLTLEIGVAEKKYQIKTQMLGEHWAQAIMAVIATANQCGIPISKILETVPTIEPFWARTQPVFLPNYQATIIRDDFNGSFDTFEPALKVLQDAEATRKIVVFSDYSDTMHKLRTRANYLGKTAAQVADLAIFIGDYADRSARMAIASGMDPARVHEFISISDTIKFLRRELSQGDLVLIKGVMGHHLSRVYLGLLGEITCNLDRCEKQYLCDRCASLGLQWHPELAPYMAAPESAI